MTSSIVTIADTLTEPSLMASAVHQRLERGQLIVFTPADQGSDALGCIDLVTTDADHINSRVCQKFQLFPKSLGSISMEVAGMVTENFSDFVEGLDDPRFIVNMHDRDQKRVFTQSVLNGFRLHPAANGRGN